MERVKNLGEIGFPNYEVDDQGNVWSLNYHSTGERRKMTPKIGSRGYLIVGLYNNGKRKFFTVHQLVGRAFLDEEHDGLDQINHKDENKKNNNLTNLEWCDCRYNSTYGTRIERISKKKSKKVNQYTKEGEFLQSFNSIIEAEKLTGICHQNISKCCKGKVKSAGNFVWRYKID